MHGLLLEFNYDNISDEFFSIFFGNTSFVKTFFTVFFTTLPDFDTSRHPFFAIFAFIGVRLRRKAPGVAVT